MEEIERTNVVVVRNPLQKTRERRRENEEKPLYNGSGLRKELL